MLDLDRVSEQSPPFMNKTVHLLRKLKEAGEPIAISMNGRGNLPVQDDDSYQLLLELVDRLETIELLKERLKNFQEGQPGISLEAVKEEARRRFGDPN